MSIFEKRLTAVLREEVADFKKLLHIDRLTGGASRITFELAISTSHGQRRLALRLNPSDGNTDGFMTQRITPIAEAKVMTIARSAGVPAPKITYILEKKDDLGEGFLMEWMTGESVGGRITKNPEFNTIRPNLASQCGNLLSKIHSINLSSSGLLEDLVIMDAKDFVVKQFEIYKALSIDRPMIDYVAQWLLLNLPRERPLTLVHNDFRNGNFLVSPSSGIEGVLDWELAHIGNPGRDIGWLCTKSWCFGVPEKEVGGFGSLDDLMACYNNSNNLDIDSSEIKFWKVFGSFWWAIGCMLMLRSYENGADRNLERPAIGRRVSECEIDCVNLLIPGKIKNARSLKEKVSDPKNAELLLSSVKEFLAEEIVAHTTGRTKFLAKVACNSIGIVIRQERFLEEFEIEEKKRLENILGRKTDLSLLRRELIQKIRKSDISLNDNLLVEHLRQTAFSQALIDQPQYPSLTNLL